MGNLAIRKVVYSGDKYYYVSPDLLDGLNIIEGDNGSGKSTFIDLINYGLGNYVKQFDKTEKERHNEVCNDANNFVELLVEINGISFIIKRYFNTNSILVKMNNDIIKKFDIYRQSSEYIFSDWFLDKLEIPVVEVFQGTKKGKINLEDLFRLIHYEQRSNPNKIYKEHRSENNFVSDSIIMRKAIFEILMGYEFADYYLKIGDVRIAEKEKVAQKAAYDEFSKIVKQINDKESDEIKNYKTDIEELEEQLKKIELYRDEQLEKSYDIDHLEGEIHQFKQELIQTEYEYSKKKNKRRDLELELTKIISLKEDRILEVQHLHKIIFTHKELNLFSPNTCPYCFNEVKREENHCICGALINEEQYEKFFYDTKEYLEMLKLKQKSLNTLELAIQSYIEELGELELEIEKLDKTRESISNNIRGMNRDVELNYNRTGISKLDNKILDIKTGIMKLEELQELYEKQEQMKKALTEKEINYNTLKEELSKLEQGVISSINTVRKDFSNIYNYLMTQVSDDCYKAEIDEDYIPFINNGIYKQASIEVQKKLMYFLTLLGMSFSEEVAFPRFLLIDTPESLGIDDDKLKKCIKFMEISVEYSYQIILTTGLNKYPQEFSKYIVQTLDKNEKQLLVLKK